MKRKPVVRAKSKRVRLTAQLVLVLALFGLGAFGYIASTVNTSALLAQAAGGAKCEPAYQKCLKTKGKTPSQCEAEFQVCVKSMCSSPSISGSIKTCNKAPDCQLHCTESASSKTGLISCCEGSAKHQNSCRDKVDGKCNPKSPPRVPDGKGEQQKLPELPKPQGGGSGGGGGGQPQSQQDPCATQGQGVASARGECMQQQDKSLSGIWNSFMPQSDTLTQNLESRESSSIDALARIAGESSEGDVSTTQSSAQAYDSGEFDVQGLRNTSDSLLNDPTPSADQPQRASAESTEIGSQSTGFKESSASMSNDVSLLGGIADRLRGALRWIGSLF